MDRILLFRPPKPTAVVDGDLLEHDVLWPSSSAPGLLALLLDDERSKKKKRAGPAVRSAARPVPETAAFTVPTATAMAMARSAPVRIPSEAAARRGRWAQAQPVGGEDGDAMVPPHEIVARRAEAHNSVLEGAGRTLKGRDLRRVRNAVLRRTGFLD
ncbi:hypothetical protein GUJ93_ZPchr0009g1666 [Zizania palustris]|uniref:Uncharacterized protein n=1 Tax=Zizania palustris TaxID=103762 RepID=A0A8J5RPW2_ZIZPA|nr:hypothetical protein GUJ93_ZPchr0009g1666 [Zizania palustris]